MGTITKRVDLEFPLLMVWESLIDSEDLAEWLMPNDFKPQVGHRFNFQTDPAPGFDGIVHSEVLELEPPNKLSISWKGGGLDSTVTFLLEETAEGTRLTLIHDGFTVRNLLPRIILGAGWRKLLSKKLPLHLAHKGDIYGA